MKPNSITLQHPYVKMITILAALIALIAGTFSSTVFAEGEWTLLNGTVTVINNGPGDSRDAHVSGDLVTYYSAEAGNTYVRYYDFLTETDAGIPKDVNTTDFLPAIDGTKIVYTHVTDNPYEINLFDTASGGNPVTLDPLPDSLRERPAVGGQTVVWMDLGDGDPSHSEIVVYDLTSGVTTRLTNDSIYDADPDISSDGLFIVWTKCQVYSTDCHTWQAAYNGNGWDIAPLAGTGNQLHPATDGQYIVYYGDYGTNPVDRNIFWQQRGINQEHELAMPETQRNPAVDNGLVVFESFDNAAATPNWDIMLYDLNNLRGFQVADTDALEILPDIGVAPNGMVHVVWQQSSVGTDSDIYANTFRLPEVASNHPPLIDQISAPLDPVMVSSTVTVTASFSDLDLADTHTALWNWGDGNTNSGLVNEASGNGTVGGNHTYSTPGVYVVTLIVSDNHDATHTEIFQYVVVYNPVGGFITGSGWFDSPAGAYTPNPSLTGKAHFGFVSRYQKGAALPSGSTEFQFKTGDLSFRSTAYDWLVVAGAKAQFKGVGTVNGSGDYGFLLTATDGQVSGGGNVDKFRIKVWDRGSGSVIYDNQLGADETAEPVTVIGGGSIVIHK